MFTFDNKIRLGAAYYPELWDEAEIDHDIEMMKEIGINCVRIGEFAWSSMEYTEGVFTFDWMINAIKKLHANGIDTVVCTPTCTPPLWLLHKYPSALRHFPDGRVTPIYSRCHICKSDKIIREKNRIIIEEMSKAVGSLDGVIGWQIDNELYTNGNGCFCPNCIHEFHLYLERKYGTLENLNKRLGMFRWSLNYYSFEDIIPPTYIWDHPSIKYEWLMFQNELIYSYVSEQADAIRKYSSLPIGTDTMCNNHLGLYNVSKNLDVMMFNHYETTEELYRTSFFYDLYRPVKDRQFWVTETQASYNGSERVWNGHHPIGNPYLNAWLPIAKGASANMYWLFREHRNGQELAHGALLYTSARPEFATKDINRASKDFKKCEKMLLSTTVDSKIAIHFSNTAVVQFEQACMLIDFNYQDWVMNKIHNSFRHYNVDVIDTCNDVDKYEVILSPFLAHLDENNLKERMLKWVENGGKWIVGPMSDIFDDSLSKNSKAPFYSLEDIAGVFTKYQLPAKEPLFKAKWNDGTELKVSETFDAFEVTDKDAVALAKYDGLDFDGYATIVERKIGKGSVVLVGSVIDKDALLRLVDKNPILNASDNMILVERTGEENYIIALEVEGKRGNIFFEKPYEDMLSGKVYSGETDIDPYTVLVLKK